MSNKIKKVCAALLAMSLLMPGALAELPEYELMHLTQPMPQIWIRTYEYEISVAADLPEGTTISIAGDESNVLMFAVPLKNGAADAFTLQLGAESGHMLRMIDDGAGGQIAASVCFCDMPEGITEEDIPVFNAAQSAALHFLDEMTIIPREQVHQEEAGTDRAIIFENEGVVVACPEESAYAVTAEPKDEKIVFYVQLSAGPSEIFAMIIGSVQGDIAIEAVDEDGQRVQIAFVMAQPPEGLSDAEINDFYMAQALVNEMPTLLKLK